MRTMQSVMPELPEVETVVRGLRELMLNKTIASVIVSAPPYAVHISPTLHVRTLADILPGRSALLVYYVIVRFDPEWKENWKHYLAVGLINSAIPFSLFAYAALHIPAGYSAVLNSTAPLFGSLFSALFLNERLTARKIVGVFTGAFGVALVAKVGVATKVDEHFIPALLAGLTAAVCYSLAGIYIRKFASHTQSLGFAGASQILGGLVLLPLLYVSPIREEMTSTVVLCLLALAILCSAFAYVLYFRLISDLGPTKALTVTFLIPVFGMIWGALFLHEAITVSMAGGALLIVVGVWFVVKK